MYLDIEIVFVHVYTHDVYLDIETVLVYIHSTYVWILIMFV